MKNALMLLLCSATVMSLVGCGDDDHAPAPVVVVDEEPREQVEVPTPEGYRYVIDPEVALPLTAHARDAALIKVVLRDTENRMPVRDELLTFELVQAPDTDATLEQDELVTDTSGRAAANLQLGESAGTALVRVSHPEAESLDIEIHVAGPRLGTFRVDVIEPTAIAHDIAPYRLSFFPAADFECADFLPRTRLENAIREQPIPNGDPVDVEGFDPGDYTIVAEALGQGGLILAGGCVDNASVAAGDVTAVAIPLDLYPISPSGKYEVSGDWDISAVVESSNSTAGTLVGVIEFMSNPGESIYTLVLTELEDAIDFPIGILLDYAGLQQQIITLINDSLFQFAPIQTFSAVANDLNDMLHNLQVTSILEIQKTDTEWQFVGHEEWTALTVDWTWRCQQNPTLNCSQYTVDLTGSGAQAATVEYDWTGFVDGFDKLMVGSHEVTFDIGRLQMYLLEQVIIPDLTGGNANSLEDALSYWVDCPGIAANALGGNDLCDSTGSFCLGQTLIEGACNAAMGAVADAVLGPIEGQDVIADMVLDGKAILVDNTPNGIADELHEGVTEGTLANSTEQVNATWTAVRILEP